MFVSTITHFISQYCSDPFVSRAALAWNPQCKAKRFLPEFTDTDRVGLDKWTEGQAQRQTHSNYAAPQAMEEEGEEGEEEEERV